MAMRADELSKQHDDLAIDVDRLHLVATSPDDALPELRMRAVVTRELLDLCSLLAQHFAFEEIGEAAALTRLHGDHAHILGQMEHLAELAGTLPIDVVKLRISDLLDALAEHERRETTLGTRASEG